MATLTKRNSLAPIISARKHMRSMVRSEIHKTIESEVTDPRNRASCRSFLQQLDRLDMHCPDSATAVCIKNGSEAWFWCYEPEFAPAGRTFVLKLPWNARYKKLLIG